MFYNHHLFFLNIFLINNLRLIKVVYSVLKYSFPLFHIIHYMSKHVHFLRKLFCHILWYLLLVLRVLFHFNPTQSYFKIKFLLPRKVYSSLINHMHAKLVKIKVFIIQKQNKNLTKQGCLLPRPCSGLFLTISADLL